MKRIRKIVDERQELELLRIEHAGFWFLFFALLVGVVAQAIFTPCTFLQVGVEFVSLMLAAIFVVVMSILKGHWDYISNPSPQVYFNYSMIGALFTSITAAAVQYKRSPMPREEMLKALLPRFAFNMIVLFVVCYILLAVAGSLTEKRRARLAEIYKDDTDE